MFCKFSINIPLVELPEEQITSAKNLNNTIHETALEAIKSVDKLDLQNGIEKKALLLESNLFAENINAITFNLQNVVADLDDGQEEKQALVQVVAKLIDSWYAVLNEINKNPEDLKVKLKASLEQVAVVSVDLLKIIEKNKLRENGQILFIALGDLQRAIDIVKIRNEGLNESPDKIKEILKDYVTRICSSISSIILQTDAAALNSIIDSVNNDCRQLAETVDIYLKQHAGKYPEDIRNLMAVTSRELNHSQVELQKLCKKTNNIADLVNLVKENVNKRAEIIAKLICALENGKVDTGSENLAAVQECPMIMSRTMKIRH